MFKTFKIKNSMKIKNLKFKIIVLFIFSTLYLLFSTSAAFAQNNTPSLQVNSLPTNTNLDVPNNLHNWTQTVMIEVMSSLSCQISGIDPTNPKGTCLGVDPITGKIGFLPKGDLEKGEVGGAIGGMGNMISVLFTPPIHTSDYFQNLAQNFGIAKKTYAQTGAGFDGLRPLLKVWEGFRNIVYLFFVLVFVVIGLAIMLRVKIDPRTVMTIQNQIPKIIIGILLVTFSYAIAGFLIDMMYVSIHIVGNLIVDSADLDSSLPTQLSQESNPFQAAGHIKANTGNALTGLWTMATQPSQAIGNIIGQLFNSSWGKAITTLIGLLLGGIIGAIIGFFTGDNIISIIVGGIAFLIIAIALLIALFRLWLALLMAYIHILIDVILAPFWIVGGLIPGSPINVGGWFRDLIANLAAFPATITMLLLGKVFYESFQKIPADTFFVPPMVGARATLDQIASLVGLGIILMTPNVVNMLKAALKAPKIEGAGGAMQPLGVAAGAPMRLLKFAGAEATHTDVGGVYTYKKGKAGTIGRLLGF